MSSILEVTEEAVAAFCCKDKVSAAVCVGEALTEESAQAVSSVARLLNVLQGLDLL